MATRPAPALAYPAYQTPAGIAPQSVRELHNTYAEAQGHAREVDSRTDGRWIPLPYAASRYWVGTPGSAWVVPPKTVYVARYKRTGAELRLMLNVVGTITGTPTGELRILLPDRLKARAIGATTLFGAAAGPSIMVLAYAPAGAKFVVCYRSDFSAWPLGSAQVTGTVTLEVEEQ